MNSKTNSCLGRECQKGDKKVLNQVNFAASTFIPLQFYLVHTVEKLPAIPMELKVTFTPFIIIEWYHTTALHLGSISSQLLQHAAHHFFPSASTSATFSYISNILCMPTPGPFHSFYAPLWSTLHANSWTIPTLLCTSLIYTACQLLDHSTPTHFSDLHWMPTPGPFHHRVVSYREFIWTKKICTQLFEMKFHRGGNERKENQSWKFGCCHLTLRNSPI